MRGRVAFYGPGHVARLEHIARLQQRGFSLAAIRELLDAWDRGADVAEIVGLPPRPASGDDGPVVSPEALAYVLGVDALTSELADRLVDLRFARVEPAGVRLIDPRVAAVDAELTRHGRALERALEALEPRDGPEAAAARLLAVLGSRVFEPR